MHIDLIKLIKKGRVICSKGIILILFLSIAACDIGKYPKNELTNPKINNALGLEIIDTLFIPLTNPELFLKIRYDIYDVFNTDTASYYIGYNDGTNAFDIFDLNLAVYIRSVAFEKDGPNSLVDLKDFVLINPSTIVAFEQNSIKKIDLVSEQITIDLPTNSRSFAPPYFDEFVIYPSAGGSEATFKNGSIYVSSKLKDVSYLDKKYYSPENLRVTKINITEDGFQFESLNINYPYEFSGKFYGFSSSIPRLGFFKNKLVYVFPSTDIIWQYSFEENKGTALNSSKYLSDELPLSSDLSLAEETKHFFNNRFYHAPRLDTNSGLLWQIVSMRYDGELIIAAIRIMTDNLEFENYIEFPKIGINKNQFFELSGLIYIASPITDDLPSNEEALYFIRAKLYYDEKKPE
ncbi:DUF4221 family protein [Peijinzhouia sedimentorum]